MSFISAGVSMAYGRISWRNMVIDLSDEVIEQYEKPLSDAYKPSEPPPRLKTLYENLKNLDIKNRRSSDQIRSERYPSVFQLCAELSQAIQTDKRYLSHLAAKNATPRSNFSDRVKIITRDSHFHAISLLHQAIKGQPADPLNHAIAGLEKYWDSFAPRDRRELFDLINVIDYLWPSCQTQVKSLLRLDSGSLTHIKPTLRFILPAAFHTFSPSERKKIANLLSLYKQHLSGEKTTPQIPDPISLDPEIDIIASLQSRLGIKRFLTTNFDLELERHIHELGYKTSPGPQVSGPTISTNSLMHRARDFVVSRGMSAPLADLAVRGGAYTIDIGHLHGRALPGEQLVATESEYQELYLLDDAYRGPLKEATYLAFRGNTLLFIGNGMGEDDILRPLRHFMSDTEGPVQPPSVALLPLPDNEPARIEEKIALLRRYGVYAVHWGYGTTALMNKTGKRGPVLSHVKNFVRSLRSALEPAPPAVSGDAAKLAEWLDHKRREFEDALKSARDKLIIDDKHVLSELVEVETLTDENHLTAPRVTIPALFGVEWKILQFLVDVAKRRYEAPARPDEPALATANLMAGEITDAVMSSFLTAMILRIAGEWHKWKDDWFGRIDLRPPVSTPVFELEESHIEASHSQAGKWLARRFSISSRRGLIVKNIRDAIPSRNIDRTYLPRWSQTYCDFLTALRRGVAASQVPKEGRRVLFLAGRRGLGKGHFFSALTDPDSFLDYAVSAGSADLIYGLFAYNLSFSVEIGSGL